MRFIGSLMQKIARSMCCWNSGTSTHAMARAALALSLGMPFSACALTVSGNLTTDTTWSASQSPITLQGAVTLAQDATLSIEPGVQIRMEPAASFTLQQGAVRALGTQNQPIVITSSKATPAPGDWGTWRFTAGTRSAQTRWDYVRVEYGSGIVIDKSSPTLNHVAVRFHNGPAIRTDLESSPVGQGLSADGNTLNAVVTPAGVISGQVTWGLVGIPYFVEQGLVEIGGANMAVEPAVVRLAASSRWPMRLVLKQPVPQGGRVVSFTTSDSSIAQAPSSLNLQQGALGADFTVATGVATGTAVITAAHPDLGSATANVQVSNQSLVELSPRQTTMLVNSPYTVNVNLSTPAPAGGLAVQLASSPAGALSHVSSVVVPQGQTATEIIVQGNAPYTHGDISAQAPGYFSNGSVTLQFADQVQVSLNAETSSISAGESQELLFKTVTPAAPRGGLIVQVTSSDTAVLSVTPSETVIGGEEANPLNAPPVTYTGVSSGTARIQLSGKGVAPTFRNIVVVKPTVLQLKSLSVNGKITLGQALVGKVRVSRQRDADSYYGTRNLPFTLRCEDAALCTAESLYIPGGYDFVDVPVTGGAVGATRLIAEAPYATTATADVTVVKPQLVWQSDSTPDYIQRDSTLLTERFMGTRQGFRVCLSLPEAAPYNRQPLNGAALVMQLGLPDQAPVGLVSAIYDREAGGTPVTEARIQNGAACTSAPMYVSEATQLGSYRIAADTTDGTTHQSALIKVSPNDQIGIGDLCCENPWTQVVVQGFSAKVGVYAKHLGAWTTPSSPVVVQLRCSDSAICTTQPTVDLGPYGLADAEITSHAPGEATLEATATGRPAIYPETATAKVKVIPPVLAFDNGEWEPPVTDVQVGQSGSYEVCLAEPKSSKRSYPSSDLQVGLASSNPAVARPRTTAMTWSAGEECIYVDMRFLLAGYAELTVNVPGVPPQSKRFEVQP